MKAAQQSLERSELEETQRGREATHLMQHPMIVGALNEIDAHYNRAWANSKVGEHEVREEAFRMIHCVKVFRRLLTDHIETGTLAEAAEAIREKQRSSTGQP